MQVYYKTQRHRDGVRHVVQAIGTPALIIKIDKQIRTIIPWAVIKRSERAFGIWCSVKSWLAIF